MKQAKINSTQLNNNLFIDHLVLNITRRCNQRCVFCFEGDRKVWDELSIEKISKLVKEAVENGITNLIFMGAEAFLRKDIFEIIKLVKELGILQIGVFTNGQVLSREDFIEQIAEYGVDYLDISFHYADAETFARCTRTPEKFFYNFIEGLERLDEFNRKNHKRINVITKTLIFSMNQGKLGLILKLIEQIFKNTYVIKGIKRIQSTEFASDSYLLDDIAERRKEIEDIKFNNKKLFFTRVPLCIIPGYEHLSTDLNYNLRKSAVLANFWDKKIMSEMHNIIENFLEEPFKDICVKCSFLGLCPMGSSSYNNKSFFPYESQRPIPSKKDVGKIIRKIAKDLEEYDFMYKNYLSINSLLKEEYRKTKV